MPNIPNRALDYRTAQGLRKEPTGHVALVKTVTADTTLNRLQSGSIVTNTGATAAVTVTLPEGNPPTGTYFEFVVSAAYELRVNPQDSQGLIANGAVQDDGLYLSADDEGETVTFTKIDGAKWLASGLTGTWTAETPPSG